MDNFLFNYYSVSLLLGGVVAVISGFIVYLNNKNRPDNKVWLAMTLSTAFWSFGYFLMTIATVKSFAWIANYILHLAAILIPLFFVLLVLLMTKFWKYQKWVFYAFASIGLFFFVIAKSSLFVVDLVPKVGFNFAPVSGTLYPYFFFYFVLLVLYGLILCLVKIEKSVTENDRYRFRYTIYFTLAAAVGGGSVFVTTFFPAIPPYPLILFSLYPLISGYGILKHQLFDTRIVTTQLITFGLWMIILLRIFFSNSELDFVINTIFFIFALFFGSVLIKNIKMEIKTKEQLEVTDKELTKKNDELKRVSDEKTEFVSLASHQIRGPLTSIKGYSSLLLEGDMGELSAEAKEALQVMIRSCDTLSSVVNDYLDVSRIEQGKMRYEFVEVDARELVLECVKELTPSIQSHGLTCDVDMPKDVTAPENWFNVRADRSKLKQVLMNLIDNSIKYTPKGKITVRLFQKEAHKVHIEVNDTGLGIAPDVMPKLFAKYTRAPDAAESNILGTGLGLYIARAIIGAHEGKVWAESAGTGKGATFIIEMKAA